MVFKYFILAVVMAVYVSGQDSAEVETTTPVVAILKQINDVNDDGSYTFGYEAADGTFKVETRDVDGNVKGKYGYLDEFGVLKTVEYNAGKTEGFTAQGDHLPEPVAPLPVAPVAPVPAAPAPQSFNRFAPQPSAPQQFAPQQFTPQQFAPQQFSPQQFAPQQFAPQQFAPQQFAPQQFAPQQFAPQASPQFASQLNNPNFASVRAPPAPVPQTFNGFAAPQQFQGFPQAPVNSVSNNIDNENPNKGFSFSFTAPASFPQPQQQPQFFNSFPQQNQFNPQRSF